MILPSLLVLLLQVAPPVIDPILEPRREPPPGQQFEQPARPTPGGEIARLAACATLAERDAQAAVAEGARWLVADGGAEAEQCLGLGYAASGDFNQAEAAFGRALAATPADDVRRPVLLAQQGNAALAGGNPGAARSALDMLLAMPALPARVRGEALLDRARAFVGLGDGPSAQADLIEAQTLLPGDRLVWLFSATLARRQGDFDAAGDLIDHALEIDQNDPATLLEAGNIAIGLNAFEVAREAWNRAVVADPEGEAGEAASRNIARLDALTSDETNVPVQTPDGLPEPEPGPEPEADAPADPAPQSR